MATYYVRTDGNDGHTGTTNTAGGAWQHINYAASQVSAGDTVRVQAGTYVESPTPSVSGTAGNTVTLIADGTVTTCSLGFSTKSYIRTIGFTLDPSTGGCSAAPGIYGSGTNTGLEFWNNTIANTGTQNGYNFDGGAGSPVRCDKCIVIGGTIQTIGTGSQTAMRFSGDDVFVGYIGISAIKYLGIGPSGVRGRFMNLYFSNMIQVGGSHPDFYYIATDSLGWNNNVVEANYGVGTITSTDNKFFHAQNDSAAAWNDNIWRYNVSYNLGSGFYSMYATTNAENRWRFYHNTVSYCDMAQDQSDTSYNNCGNFDQEFGPALSASVYNSIHYKAWGLDTVDATVLVFGTKASPTLTTDYNLAYSPVRTETFGAPWTSQSHPQSNVNPQYVNTGTDFTLQSGSGARGVGGPLTTATSCSGTTLNVASGTGSFFIGSNASNLAQYSGNLVPGDFITVNSTNYQVSSVSSDALTLTGSISCSNGDAVYFGKSSTVDVGAYPYKAGGYNLSANFTNIGGTVTVTPSDATLVRFIVCYEDGIPVGVVNTAPYTFSVGSGVITVRAYHKYASTAQYSQATSGDTQEWMGCFPVNRFSVLSLLDY